MVLWVLLPFVLFCCQFLRSEFKVLSDVGGEDIHYLLDLGAQYWHTRSTVSPSHLMLDPLCLCHTCSFCSGHLSLNLSHVETNTAGGSWSPQGVTWRRAIPAPPQRGMCFCVVVNWGSCVHTYFPIQASLSLVFLSTILTVSTGSKEDLCTGNYRLAHHPTLQRL